MVQRKTGRRRRQGYIRSSIKNRVLLAVVLPPIILSLLVFVLLWHMETIKLRESIARQTDQLRITVGRLLEVKQENFKQIALRLSYEPDLVAFFSKYNHFEIVSRLDYFRENNRLASVALLNEEGQIRAISGQSPQLLNMDIKERMERFALSAGAEVFFAEGRDGLYLTGLLPVFSESQLRGSLLLISRMELGPEFQNATLVHRGRTVAQSPGSGFLAAYAQRIEADPAGDLFAYPGSAVQIARIPLSGLSVEQGYLLTGVNRRDDLDRTGQMARQGAQLLMAAVLILTLLAGLVTRKLTAPLVRLVQVANRISQGETEVQWPPTGQDEVGQLNAALAAMTERLHTSVQEARQAELQAQKANQSKSQFLANMSHELRTPLNAILGIGRMLEQSELTEAQREQLHQIQTSGELLLAVLNDLLDVTRIESNQLELEIQPFNLKKLIHDLCGVIRPQAEEKGIALRLHYEPDTPETVEGDPNRIRQILMNLINNAIKFTREGYVAVDVRSRNPQRQKAEFVFTVKDTGIGMEQYKVNRLFTAFEQGDSSMSRRFGGAGLGLAITRQLVSKMGGKVAVLSEPGQGSAFTVLVPLKTTAVRAVKKEEEPVESLHWSRPPKVLLAEDNKMNQIVARRFLEKSGCEVTVAENGAEALICFAGQAFDLILMDCQMPEVDGYEATAHIREKDKNIPIVALTAHALKEDRGKCLAAGMNEHLTKPIREERMNAVLAAQLNTLLMKKGTAT